MFQKAVPRGLRVAQGEWLVVVREVKVELPVVSDIDQHVLVSILFLDTVTGTFPRASDSPESDDGSLVVIAPFLQFEKANYVNDSDSVSPGIILNQI